MQGEFNYQKIRFTDGGTAKDSGFLSDPFRPHVDKEFGSFRFPAGFAGTFKFYVALPADKDSGVTTADFFELIKDDRSAAYGANTITVLKPEHFPREVFSFPYLAIWVSTTVPAGDTELTTHVKS